jgi:hypothetical protein
VFVLYSVQVYPAVFVISFIPAAVILLASLALLFQFSLRRNEAGSASVLYHFILVFFKVSCGLSVMFIMPIIFK